MTIGAAGAADIAPAHAGGRLILASASPRRRALLAQIGVMPAAILPADIDETPCRGELPRIYARRMAVEKCNSIISFGTPGAGALNGRHSDRVGKQPVAEDGVGADAAETPFILAADTVVSLGRRILGKPRDASEAARFLMLLSGRRHRVMTAICLRHGTRMANRLVETRVKVKRLSDREISAYLRSDEWRGKAGGYAIQGLFGAFIPEIHGSYSNIVGLPLTETAALLEGMGYHVPYEPSCHESLR